MSQGQLHDTGDLSDANEAVGGRGGSAGWPLDMVGRWSTAGHHLDRWFSWSKVALAQDVHHEPVESAALGDLLRLAQQTGRLWSKDSDQSPVTV